MATGSSSIAVISCDAILRNLYLDGAKDLMNDETTVMGWLTHKQTQGGRNMIGTVRTGRTFSHGAQAAGGTLPTPQTIVLQNVTVPTKYLYMTLKITNELLKQASGQPGSSARSLTTVMEGSTRDFKDNVNRMFMGTGTGRIGTTASVGGAGNTVWTLTDFSDTRKFGIGQVLNAWDTDASGSAQRSTTTTGVNFTVTAVDPVAGTITVNENAGASAVVATDFITYAGARTSTVRFEPMGLDGAVAATNPPLDTTGLFGIDRTTVIPWRSYVNTAGANRPISGTLLQAGLDAARINGGGRIDGMFAPFGVRAEYGELQQNVRRTINTNEYRGNTSGGFKDFLEYNNIEIIPEKHCPANKIIMVQKDAIWIEDWADWDWMADDGNILTKVQTPGIEPAYYAVMYKYSELYVYQPSACSKLEAITGTDPVAGF